MSEVKYRILQVGEVVQCGDQLLNPPTGKWMITTPGFIVGDCDVGRYRRPIDESDPKYRILKTGEIIQEGDQFLSHSPQNGLDNTWMNSTRFGSPILSGEVTLYRRPVTNSDPKQTQDDSNPKYRELKVGEKIRHGDQYVDGVTGKWTDTESDGMIVLDSQVGIYRRPITDSDPNRDKEDANPKYRMLEAGEVIQKGDQVGDGHGVWWTSCVSGQAVEAKSVGFYRRRIKTDATDIVSKTIEERGKTYGEPQESMRNIGVAWTAILQQHYGIKLEHEIPAWVAANMLVAFKLQRTLKGWHEDNYIDAEAYLRFAKEGQKP